MENPKQNEPGLGQAVAVTAVIVAIMLVGIFAFSALINEMLPTAKTPEATPAGVVQSGPMEAAQTRSMQAQQSYQTQTQQTANLQSAPVSTSSGENLQSSSKQSPILFSLKKPWTTAQPAAVQQKIRNGIIDLTNYWKLMRHAEQTVAMANSVANGLRNALASILPGNRGVSVTPAGVQQQTAPQSAPSKAQTSSSKALPPYLLISTLTELKKKRSESSDETPAN